MPAVCHAMYTGHNLAADQFYLLCIAGSVGVIGIHSLSLTPDAGRAPPCYFPYPLFLPSLLPFLDCFLQPVTSSIASLPDKSFFPLFDLYFYSRSLPPVAIHLQTPPHQKYTYTYAPYIYIIGSILRLISDPISHSVYFFCSSAARLLFRLLPKRSPRS